MDVQVYPYLSGISWRASLLCGDSYLLTAGPQAATYSFVVINENILSVQNIKDLLSSLPAWEFSALHLRAGGGRSERRVHSCTQLYLCAPGGALQACSVLQTRSMDIFHRSSIITSCLYSGV